MEGYSLIKEIGRSFIYSAFMPAAFFCIAIFYVFQDFFPGDVFLQMQNNNVLAVIGQWIMLLIIPTWIAFFLFSSIDWIMKLFSGEFLPFFIRKPLIWLKQWQLGNKAKNYIIIKKILAKPIELRTQKDEEVYDKHWAAAMGELQELEMKTPLDDVDVMPTQLGNVLHASEVYAEERYFVDPIHAWPRLFAVLPRQFITDMEEKHNRLMFLLNSSLLASIMFIASLLTGVVGNYRNSCSPNQFCNILQNQKFLQDGFGTTQPTYLLILSIAFLGFGYFSYLIAVNAAQDFSLFYRAGFDIYRNELLECLQCELPGDLGEERNRWFEVSSFFYAGEKMTWDKSMVKYPFYHNHKKNDKQSKNKPRSK